jgi:hypothetical protein
VDYIGDLAALEKDLPVAAIARQLHPQAQLAFRSDKFSIYPIAARLSKGWAT